MVDLNNIISVGSIFFSFLTCIILFFRKSNKLFANRMLSFVFLGSIWYLINFLLDVTGWISHIPLLFGAGIPFYYAIPVLGYLYLRVSVKQQSHFSKYDWLHFLPAIISFAFLLPFYCMDMSAKQKLADAVSQNYNALFFCKMGLIPNVWHVRVRPVQGLFYAVLQWRLLIPFLKQSKNITIHTVVKKWLVMFAAFQSLIYIILAIATLLGQINLSAHADMLNVIRIPFMTGILIFLALSTYLFFSPEILYNISPLTLHPAPVIPDRQPPADRETAIQEGHAETPEICKEKEHKLNPEMVLSYAAIIENHIVANNFFRRQSITINDLAAEVYISPRNVSYVLNQHFDQRFTEYINSHRIGYIQKRLLENYWKVLTLEGLAMEAGFSSRNTFLLAFKKNVGLSPSEYVLQLKKKMQISKV